MMTQIPAEEKEEVEENEGYVQGGGGKGDKVKRGLVVCSWCPLGRGDVKSGSF